METKMEAETITMKKPLSDINLALFNIRRDISAVNKSRKGYNYKYADLKDCHNALDPLLEREGVVWITEPHCTDDGRAGVAYSAIHIESGTSRDGTLMLPMVDGDPQKAGSAITYSRRYALAIFGLLTEEDDDGRASTKKKLPAKEKKTVSSKYITMDESMAFLTKCRLMADNKFKGKKDKADAEYMRIGKALVSHLGIEKLGGMEPSMVDKANKFLLSIDEVF